MVWRLLSVLEVGLRLGTGAGLVERVLRQAIDEAPGLDVYRPWLAAEFNRGLARELADAGRALSGYDAQPWAHQLRLPAVSLITTTDRLVRPSEQRELAEALARTGNSSSVTSPYACCPSLPGLLAADG